MPTSVLTLIQTFTDKMNLPTPTALIGSQEKSVRQYRAILRELISDLGEYRWQNQTLIKNFPSVLGLDQGALKTIFGDGYYGLVDDTFWNSTKRMRIFGPLPDPVWQALQILPNAGPQYQYWISQGHIYVSPPQIAGDTLSVMYITNSTVLSVDGVTTKTLVTVDSDSLLFPDNVVLQGFEAKWRFQKGDSAWQVKNNDYLTLLAKNIVRDGAPLLTMGEPARFPQPGIVIPAGSWNVH